MKLIKRGILLPLPLLTLLSRSVSKQHKRVNQITPLFCLLISSHFIMAKKEILTDLWVLELLKEANIELSPQ
jgi:hypothetical protein